MRYILVILPVTVALGACATSETPMKAYIGSERPVSEIAILKAGKDPREFRTAFIEYGEGRIQVGTQTTGAVSEIRLLPGEYTVRLLCSGPTSSGRPYLFIRVSAGKTYEISCSRTGGDERQVRGGVTAISDTLEAK
jgi:hypothetical protein